MLFDTHAHFDDERFDEDRYETIENAHRNGIEYIMNAGADPRHLEAGLHLSEKYDFVYSAVGAHPEYADIMDDEKLEKIKSLASNNKVVAIGEIGLDYYYETPQRDIQKIWFARQINLAKELKLPIIVHDRDAHEDTLNIIKAENARDIGGVFHCYSGSVEMAKIILNHNFYISVGGVITFKNAKKAVEVLKYIPMDRLVLETDSPYLTPEPYRGKRNDSGYVKYVAQKVAEVKGITFDDVSRITTENGKKLFNIK